MSFHDLKYRPIWSLEIWIDKETSTVSRNKSTNAEYPSRVILLMGVDHVVTCRTLTSWTFPGGSSSKLSPRFLSSSKLFTYARQNDKTFKLGSK